MGKIVSLEKVFRTALEAKNFIGKKQLISALNGFSLEIDVNVFITVVYYNSYAKISFNSLNEKITKNKAIELERLFKETQLYSKDKDIIYLKTKFEGQNIYLD